MVREEYVTEKMAEKFLKNLIACHAFELHYEEWINQILIPYIMNDAVECYLCLHGCKIHGELDKEYLEGMEISFAASENAKGVFVKQVSGNVVSIWYQSMTRVIKNCQYHRIGHAWRKKRGEEFVRRLVNLICVIHDKVNYLGEEFCDETECELAALAEFPPCLYFTPINGSILDWYPESQKGIEAAKAIALIVGDQKLYDQLSEYEILFNRNKIKEKQFTEMAESLAREEHAGFWHMLYRKIEQASSGWEVRDYGPMQNQRIQQMKDYVVQKYRQQGYEGEYPTLVKTSGQWMEKVSFVEEQPFTVMESKDFQYRIYSMNFGKNGLQCEYEEEVSWKMTIEKEKSNGSKL